MNQVPASPTLTRRKWLGATLAGGAALTAYALTGGHSTQAQTAVTSAQGKAALAFLDTLGADRAKAALALNAPARTDWHWFPPANFTRREGVPLAAMTATQREAALALLRSLTTQTGFDKTLAIMSLQLELGREDDAYFFSVYGPPSDSAAWAVGIEGHHLSLNYSIRGTRLIAAPVFLGAAPTRVESGPRKGLQAMRIEEENARALMRSLSPALQREALFASNTPGDTISRNAVSVRAPARVGVTGKQLNAEQRALLLTLVDAYTEAMPEAVAKTRRTQASSEIESLRFGWAGSLKPGERYYYRVQGASWMIDHDNSRDSGRHIHSQWREFQGDFGLG
jgi:hypothetical protein